MHILTGITDEYAKLLWVNEMYECTLRVQLVPNFKYANYKYKWIK